MEIFSCYFMSAALEDACDTGLRPRNVDERSVGVCGSQSCETSVLTELEFIFHYHHHHHHHH